MYCASAPNSNACSLGLMGFILSRVLSSACVDCRLERRCGAWTARQVGAACIGGLFWLQLAELPRWSCLVRRYGFTGTYTVYVHVYSTRSVVECKYEM